ncbi:phage holin family protein [Kineococcus rubinsiae]|uniref:phage holin family protein n=1 Tax=Kineococcus rubinsiae TaxID=2609562 RepID=UPI0014313020|nr:phage holin family protein [Kineococcus rubinsiae]NIZ92433.1 phage holin family protein [Kineococcus rubinsiae]
MSPPTSSTTGAHRLSVHRDESAGGSAPAAPSDATVGQLVSDLTQQMSRLVRDEVAVAQLDLKAKGKKAGFSLGAFSAAGLLAFFALGSLVATAVLALSHAVDGWLAALIVAVVLLVLAGVAALVGKKELDQATPPLPQASIDGLKTDAATVKEGLKR